MTWSSIISKARRHISDAVAPYRYADTDLLKYGAEARREIIRRHPEGLYVSSITTTLTESDPALADEILILAQYDAALADYIAYRALGEDSEDSSNAKLAREHFTAFQAAM